MSLAALMAAQGAEESEVRGISEEDKEAMRRELEEQIRREMEENEKNVARMEGATQWSSEVRVILLIERIKSYNLQVYHSLNQYSPEASSSAYQKEVKQRKEFLMKVSCLGFLMDSTAQILAIIDEILDFGGLERK